MSVTARLPDGREEIDTFADGTAVGAALTLLRDAYVVRGGLITNPDGNVMLSNELLRADTAYLFSKCQGQFISFAD